MSIMDRLPGMEEDRLRNLQSNALRLADEGSAAQRRDAAELLPVIEAELETRRVAKLEQAKAARKAAASRPAARARRARA